MANAIATWTIELNADCPKCGEYVDLTEADDFWHDNSHIAIAESGTKATTDMDVMCPECGHEFMVDLEY